MHSKLVSTFGICAAFVFSTGTVQAEPQIEQKAKKAVQTLTKKVTKTVKNTGKQVTRRAKGVAKQATNTSLAAVKNLPTPEWNKLQSAYEYPQGETQVEESPQENANVIQINLTFTGPSGKPVEGVFFRPKAEKIYPCVLVLHGLTNNKEIALKMFRDKLLKNGMAVLALDAPEHGKTQPKDKSYWSKKVIEVAVHEGVRNYRSVLDWLTERQDIDPSRIGALGYSMGSITSVILGAVDNRVSAFSLCVGGDPFLVVAQVQPPAQREAIFAVCPSLFVSHLAGRPILFQNGKKDVVVVPPAAMLLHNSAQAPKEVAWYNGGHDLPEAIQVRAVNWITKKLASAQPAADGQQK